MEKYEEARKESNQIIRDSTHIETRKFRKH